MAYSVRDDREQSRGETAGDDDREAFADVSQERRERRYAEEREQMEREERECEAREEREARRERGDGRIAPGEVRNPWGRAGKPENRRCRDDDEPQDFESAVERALRKVVTVREGGKLITLKTAEYLARKAVNDLANAPLKQRLELLFSRRSSLRPTLERAMEPEREASLWTEEFAARYQVVMEPYDLAQRDEERREDQELYRAYQRWCREREDSDAEAFARLSKRERFDAFLDERDEERRRRDRFADERDGFAERSDGVRADNDDELDLRSGMLDERWPRSRDAEE